MAFGHSDAIRHRWGAVECNACWPLPLRPPFQALAATIPPLPAPLPPTNEQAPQRERLDEEQVHQVQHHRQQRKPQQAVLQALHAGVVQQLAVGANLRGRGWAGGREHICQALAMNQQCSCMHALLATPGRQPKPGRAAVAAALLPGGSFQDSGSNSGSNHSARTLTA